MASVWTNNGKIVMMNGKVVLCDQCPCGCLGWPGFKDPETRFNRYEYRDWDCCFRDDKVKDGDVDGHVTFAFIPPDKAKVIESTGNYAPDYPVGTIFSVGGDAKTGCSYPIPMSGDIVSNTRRNSDIIDGSCCNPEGNKIYAIMWNDGDEEDFE